MILDFHNRANVAYKKLKRMGHFVEKHPLIENRGSRAQPAWHAAESSIFNKEKP